MSGRGNKMARTKIAKQSKAVSADNALALQRATTAKAVAELELAASRTNSVSDSASKDSKMENDNEHAKRLKKTSKKMKKKLGEN